SFVSQAGDRSVPVERLLIRPGEILGDGANARNRRIPLPADLRQPSRKNSRGMEFGDARELEALTAATRAGRELVAARPLIAGLAQLDGVPREVRSPIDGTTVVGTVVETPVDAVAGVVTTALAAFPAWSATPVGDRAAALERLGDLIEADRDRLVALLS